MFDSKFRSGPKTMAGDEEMRQLQLHVAQPLQILCKSLWETKRELKLHEYENSLKLIAVRQTGQGNAAAH